MTFDSLQYFLFLAVVLLLYHGVFQSTRSRNWLLFIAGSVFYGTWSPFFLLLLYATVVVDYTVGRALASRVGSRRAILLASLLVNLGVLGFFKYTGFIAANVEAVGRLFGANLHLPRLSLSLPLGISFYTFLSVSYTIDVYRRVCEPARSLLEYGVFVTFFPHLIAGPILRGNEFLPQVHQPRPMNRRIFWGVNQILVGLIKKSLCADWLARFVEPVYASPASYDGVASLMATYFYAFQIYFDFSGYIDIALGSAALLGYEMPANFNRPYLATNITDFWRRWHMTLSRWLRDYVYIPLGGNRRGHLRTYVNLLLTMLIGGLWHGPSWSFVLWGGLHGLLLALHKRFRELRPAAQPSSSSENLKRLLLFQLLCLAWIFFRAADLDTALLVLKQIASIPVAALHGALPLPRLALALLASPILLGIYFVFSQLRRSFDLWTPLTQRGAWAYGAMTALLLACLAACAAPPAPFIYFVF